MSKISSIWFILAYKKHHLLGVEIVISVWDVEVAKKALIPTMGSNVTGGGSVVAVARATFVYFDQSTSFPVLFLPVSSSLKKNENVSSRTMHYVKKRFL